MKIKIKKHVSLLRGVQEVGIKSLGQEKIALIWFQPIEGLWKLQMSKTLHCFEFTMLPRAFHNCGIKMFLITQI